VCVHIFFLSLLRLWVHPAGLGRGFVFFLGLELNYARELWHCGENVTRGKAGERSDGKTGLIFCSVVYACA
jgi:hypothetical protein